MNWQLVQSVLWENKGLPWLLPPPHSGTQRLPQGHAGAEGAHGARVISASHAAHTESPAHPREGPAVQLLTATGTGEATPSRDPHGPHCMGTTPDGPLLTGS